MLSNAVRVTFVCQRGDRWEHDQLSADVPLMESVKIKKEGARTLPANQVIITNSSPGCAISVRLQQQLQLLSPHYFNWLQVFRFASFLSFPVPTCFPSPLLVDFCGHSRDSSRGASYSLFAPSCFLSCAHLLLPPNFLLISFPLFFSCCVLTETPRCVINQSCSCNKTVCITRSTMRASRSFFI